MKRLADIPASLFQPDTENEAGTDQALQIGLHKLLERPDIQQLLLNCAQALWKPLAEIGGFVEWARQVLADTLAAGVQQTLSTLLPDVDERAVVTDSCWMRDLRTGAEWLEIWLCEMESGGSGILIRLQKKWAEDPVSFLNVLVRNLSASDYEQIDYDLRTVLQMLQTDHALRMAISPFVKPVTWMPGRRLTRIFICSFHSAVCAFLTALQRCCTRGSCGRVAAMTQTPSFISYCRTGRLLKQERVLSSV